MRKIQSAHLDNLHTCIVPNHRVDQTPKQRHQTLRQHPNLGRRIELWYEPTTICILRQALTVLTDNYKNMGRRC
jgi:hypothetical protein